MNATQVSDYVTNEVNRLSDLRLRPLIESINNKIGKIRQLEGEIKVAQDDIAGYQKALVDAKAEVETLRDKLTTATAAAVR